MKKGAVILFIAIAALFTIGIFKDQVIRSVVSAAATNVLGAPVQVRGFSLGIIKQSVRITGLKVFQPQAFPKGVLVDITTIGVDYDLGALLRKKIHLRSAELDIKEINIIRNKDGQLNVEALKVMAEQKKPKEEKAAQKPAPEIPMQIDVLKLNVGSIVYRDYSAGDPPSVQVYDSGIHNKTYKNITSAQQLVTLILSESLKNTAIKSAKVYAASAVLGVGFLPAGVAITLLGKDSARQEFDLPYQKVYDAALKILRSSGLVKSETKSADQGGIKAVINKNDVTVKIGKISDRQTRVEVSARRTFLPKPEVAKGVLLQISEKLK